jgi:uncharacterized membrane protein YeaQ/YmgE (transglycosylase-associated protein family)
MTGTVMRRLGGICGSNRNPGFSPPEEEKNMWDLVVFAVIGLLAGAAVRLLYPGREPLKVLGTLVVGLVGAVLGGLLSWAIWPAVEGQLSFGALLMSFLGAVLVLALVAIFAYARSISASRNRVP